MPGGDVTDISTSTFYEDKSKQDIVNLIHDEIVALRNTLTSVLVGSATFNAGSLADGAGETTTVTVTGAALGDFALCSLGVDVAGITVTAYVSAADTVSVRLQNESGGTLDLASTTLRAMVIKSTAVALAAKVLTK